MKSVVFAIVILLVSTVAFAGGGPEGSTLNAGMAPAGGYTLSPAPNYTPSDSSVATERVTVQRVNTYKYWRPGDEIPIGEYLRTHKLSAENYSTLKTWFPQAVGSGQLDARDCNGKLILNQPPVHYITMCQSYYGVTAGTDWYVRVPRRELPAFQGSGSQGGLVLEPVPNPRPVCDTCQPAGTHQFGQEATVEDHDIAAVLLGLNRSHGEKKQETCDPLKPGDPRIPVPPPPGAAATWSPKPLNERGGLTSNPLPSHPRVADPVH